MRFLPFAAVAVVALAAGCAGPGADDWAQVREVTPAFLTGVAVRDPALATAPGGRVALTWVTRDSAGRDVWLALSRDSGATFSAPVRVNDAPGSVVSFAEGRPLAVFGPRGALAVTWSERRADTSGAVDVKVRASADGGASFGPVATVNDDAQGPPPELGWSAARRWRRANRESAFHGFPALAYLPDGTLFSAWLDERRVPAADGEPVASSLFHALSPDGGRTWTANAALTDSACPCCRPQAIVAGERLALAYRSAASMLRDPALALSADGGRTFASDTVIHPDRWLLAGCPDQGTVVAWTPAAGGHYAWYTGAGGGAVYVVPWRDDGGAAGLRRAIDDGVTAARSPRIAGLGALTLLGVEARPAADSTRQVFAVRALHPDGSMTPWLHLGADAASGWLAAAGERAAFACWLEHDGAVERLRVVRLALRRPRG
jgi:hypothetical protein